MANCGKLSLPYETNVLNEVTQVGYIYIYIYSLQLAAVLRTLVAAAFHAVNMQACIKLFALYFQECHIYWGNNNDET